MHTTYGSLMAVFLAAVAAACVVAPVLLLKATTWGLVDKPGGRKQHAAPTPVIGGLCIFAGMGSLLFASGNPLFHLPFVLLALATLAIGVWDDRVQLSASLRLLVQLGLGLAMATVCGLSLQSLGNLFGTGPIMLGMAAVPVTMFCVAAAKNAINMVDGVDGLAAGLSMVPIVAVGWAAATAGQWQLAHKAYAAMGALMVFMAMNFPLPGRERAAAFLGDAGSTLLGLICAWLLIRGANHGLYRPVFALYALCLPLLDSACVMLRRTMRGQHPFTPGRDHIHHILIDGGMPKANATYLLTALAVLVAMLGWALERAQAPELLCLSIFVAMLGLNYLSLLEPGVTRAFIAKALLRR